MIARDSHKCTQCGSKDELHAHHVKPWAKYPKLRYVITNGLTLCRKCHYKEHRWMARSCSAQRVYKADCDMRLFYDDLHGISYEQAILESDAIALGAEKHFITETGGKWHDSMYSGSKILALRTFRLFAGAHFEAVNEHPSWNEIVAEVLWRKDNPEEHKRRVLKMFKERVR